jgi:hypothetical protein
VVVRTLEVGLLLLLLLLLIERRGVQYPRAALYGLAWQSHVSTDTDWSVFVFSATSFGPFLLPHVY